MTKVKICGLTSLADIEIVNECKPDYIGFVFYYKSKRFVDKNKARELKNKLSKDIMAVGVFVDEEISTVAELANEHIIDVIQLHGHEDEEYMSNLRAKLTENTKIIKAFMINDKSDIDKANASSADILLLDNGYGTGEQFDWDNVSDVNKKFFLAGGLSPENVSEAISKLKPFGVDVSSRVETDGKKDRAKVVAFCENARGI